MLLILFFPCVTVKPSNTASHDNLEKINSWVSFCFPYEYGAPSGRRSSVLISLLRLTNFCYAGQQRHRCRSTLSCRCPRTGCFFFRHVYVLQNRMHQSHSLPWTLLTPQRNTNWFFNQIPRVQSFQWVCKER